jgi:hypothetical protein
MPWLSVLSGLSKPPFRIKPFRIGTETQTEEAKYRMMRAIQCSIREGSARRYSRLEVLQKGETLVPRRTANTRESALSRLNHQ